MKAANVCAQPKLPHHHIALSPGINWCTDLATNQEFSGRVKEYCSKGAARVASQCYAPVFAAGISALISFNCGSRSTAAKISLIIRSSISTTWFITTRKADDHLDGGCGEGNADPRFRFRCRH